MSYTAQLHMTRHSLTVTVTSVEKQVSEHLFTYTLNLQSQVPLFDWFITNILVSHFITFYHNFM